MKADRPGMHSCLADDDPDANTLGLDLYEVVRAMDSVAVAGRMRITCSRQGQGAPQQIQAQPQRCPCDRIAWSHHLLRLY